MDNMNDTTTLPSSAPLPLPPEVVQGRAIRDVYIWVLVGVGLPGNLACLVTVLTMHVTTATAYVALLAAADSMALLMKLVYHQLITHGKMTAAACVLHLTPTFISCYANWVLALICFERFFAVCFPLKKQVYFTKRKVYISIAILTVVLAACFCPTLFFFSDVHPSRKKCVNNPDLLHFKLDFFDTFTICLYFFAPFLLIAVLTTLIIVGLQRHRLARQRMGMARTGGGGGGGNDGGVERSISIMLLCAGLVFLLLQLPVCLHHLFLKQMYNMKVREERAQLFLLYQVVTMLSDVNHAVNFIIYFLSAGKFRKRFAELVKRCLCFDKCQKGDASSHSEGTHLTQVSQFLDAKDTPDSTAAARRCTSLC